MDVNQKLKELNVSSKEELIFKLKELVMKMLEKKALCSSWSA